MVHLYQQGVVTLSEAARLTRVGKRQALGDLKTVADHAPVRRMGEGREARWVLQPGFDTRRLGFLEQIAFSIGRDHTRWLRGTVLDNPYTRVDDRRLVGSAPASAAPVDRLFAYVGEPARSYEGKEEVIDRVLDALWKGRKVGFTYGAKARVMEDMQPLTLVFYRRSLYLIARRADGKERLFAVDRIDDVLLDGPFPYPSDWDPEAWLAPYFGIFRDGPVESVVLRFSAERAALVKARAWHSTAELRDLRDGRVELSMTTGGPELVRFVLEWGEHCEVVAPNALRDQVVAALQAALATYQAPAVRLAGRRS